jgi:hypothetical protein
MTQAWETAGTVRAQGVEPGPDLSPVDVVQLERLQARIRQQVACRRVARSTDGAGPLSPKSLPQIDWCTIVAGLHAAEQHADVLRRLPPLPERSGSRLRYLLRWCLSRLVRAGSRSLLTEQSEFNNAALSCLRSLQLGLYQLAQSNHELGQEVERLREAQGKGRGMS